MRAGVCLHLLKLLMDAVSLLMNAIHCRAFHHLERKNQSKMFPAAVHLFTSIGYWRRYLTMTILQRDRHLERRPRAPTLSPLGTPSRR